MLRASFSYSSLKASAERSQVSFASDSANTTLRVSFTDLSVSLNYVKLVASFVALSEPLNRYLVDQFQIADLASLSLEKGFTEVAYINEELSFSYSASKSDAVSVSDNLSKFMLFSRDFADSATVSETHAVSFNKPQTETISVSESADLATSLDKSDSVSVSESFGRTVVYSRSFSDAFTLDDLANIGDLQKDTSLDKGNVFSISETLSLQAAKAVADTLAMQEEIAKSFALNPSESVSISEQVTFDSAKSLTDTATVSDAPSLSSDIPVQDSLSMSESITVVLLPAGGGVFNDGVFNAFAFNE